jgi:hypothetical protein
MLRVAIVIGSTRPGRRNEAIVSFRQACVADGGIYFWPAGLTRMKSLSHL